MSVALEVACDCYCISYAFRGKNDISTPKNNVIDFRDFAVFAADWRKY
ncbi:MAG: hypothetical protein ABSB25_01370 [Sedimentisphaerales bacterium]